MRVRLRVRYRTGTEITFIFRGLNVQVESTQRTNHVKTLRSACEALGVGMGPIFPNLRGVTARANLSRK